MVKITLTADFLSMLHDLTILPRYNSSPPAGGTYGWMREGAEINIGTPITIEESVGLYGGGYKPFRGGQPFHDFATVGSFSSCASPLPEAMVVGRYCGISTGMRIIDSAHPLNTLTTSGSMFRPNNHIYKRVQTPALRDHARAFRHVPEQYPVLGNDVWIGANVTLLPTVKIGHGAVIASGSMVTKDVPSYAIVGGNPARVIRSRFPEEIVSRLVVSQWWQYEPSQVFSQDPTHVASILDRLEAGTIDPYIPRKIMLGQG